MFCYKCGQPLPDDAVFCSKCGTKQPNSEIYVKHTSSTTTVPTNSNELDREALKIYLGNILALECIKRKYQRNLEDYDYKAKKLKNSNCYKRYVLYQFNSRKDDNRYLHLCYKDNEFYVATYDDFSGVWTGELLKDEAYAEGVRWAWKKIPIDSPFHKQLSTADFWKHKTHVSAGFLEKRRQKELIKNSFVKIFNEYVAFAPEEHKKNTAKIDEYLSKMYKIIQELSTAKKLLKEAYDVNIIPSNFRNNIYAIYYLHDFVSTSQESFTTALLHYDLNEIKVKLDKIISQQESIIIQNALMMSQNNEIIRQNQQKLNSLAKIESNTSQAAKYTQIAANNTEICAWLSAATYLETKEQNRIISAHL